MPARNQRQRWHRCRASPARGAGSRVARYHLVHFLPAPVFWSRRLQRVSKIDVTEAFGQVSVQWVGAPVYGHGFREWVVADRRLQFRWRSSTGDFCLFAAAREYAHRHVIRRRRGDGTGEHRDVAYRGQPTESGRPSPSLPPECRVPRGPGRGGRSLFCVQYYADDGILVEVRWWSDGRRCRRASESLGSDHF